MIIQLSFVMILWSVGIARADCFSFKGVDRVYIYETTALFSGKGFKVEAPRPSDKFYRIEALTRDYFENAVSIESYNDLNAGIRIPRVIMFSGKDGKVVGVGLIVYRNRLKKSFLQMREFTQDNEGNIVIGGLTRKYQQTDADGMELNGDFMDEIDRAERANGKK